MTETPTIEGVNVIPGDLSRPAVKLARRVQGLPDGRMYLLVLAKDTSQWGLTVLCPDCGHEVEVLK